MADTSATSLCCNTHSFSSFCRRVMVSSFHTLVVGYLMTQRRKLFPMPITGLIDHPDFVRLPAAGRGMIISLLLTYWQGECQALSTSRSEMFIAARANPPNWIKHRETILKVFNDVKPELDAYFAYRTSRKSTLEILSARARSNARAKRLEENRPVTLGATEAVPVREFERRERVQTPEERGPRAKFSPGRK